VVVEVVVGSGVDVADSGEVTEADLGEVTGVDSGEAIEGDLEEGIVVDGVDLATEEVEDEVVSVVEEGLEAKPLNAGVEASTVLRLLRTRKLLSTKRDDFIIFVG